MVGIKIRTREGERKEGKNKRTPASQIQTNILYICAHGEQNYFVNVVSVKTLFLKEGSVYDAVH